MLKNDYNKTTFFNKEVFIELVVIIMLVTSFVISQSILTLLAFMIACLLIVASNYTKSIYYLSFFTSFAGIFVYKGRHMFFVMVALFIFRSIVENKASKNTLRYYTVILFYCILFCDLQGVFSFAKLIGIILLFAIPLIGFSSDKINSEMMVNHYILGFVIQTILGHFIKNIPAMHSLFETDLIWTENYTELTRFFGLAYDSNFYALSNYIIVAYILFAYKKLNIFRGILCLFLVISGIQTISKSYFLVISFLFVCFIFKNMSNYKQFIFLILVCMIGICLFTNISNNLGYNPLELTLSRFEIGEGFAENSTGRMDIWVDYFNLLSTSSIKNLLFGFGFNAQVIHAAHNTFIEFLFHYGIVGCMIWISYFVYCFQLFYDRTVGYVYKSPLICFSLLIGIFFLSAYTYESFWFGIVVSLLTLGKSKRIEVINV